MTYGRFLEYLEMGWVKQVDLYDNRNAIVQASSPELGNRPQSISGNTYGCFTTYPKVERIHNFDAHPAPRKVFS
jgi:cell division protease FtsH